jgi:hypothetical protein
MASNTVATDFSEKKTEDPYRPDYDIHSETTVEKTDLLGLESTDPVLNAKMHLVNNVCLSDTLLYIFEIY